MRIIGGRLKGLSLAPVAKGSLERRLRPTSARARTVMFDLLTHGGRGNLVERARVLDLFAGTGALGLEAVSRGAGSAVFVENWTGAVRVIEQNIARAGVASCVRLLRRDAARLGTADGQAFTLVFLDPPYGSDFGERAVRSALAGGWIGAGAIVAAEGSSPLRLPGLLEPIVDRRVGPAWIAVAEVSAKVTVTEPAL